LVRRKLLASVELTIQAARFGYIYIINNIINIYSNGVTAESALQ